MLTRGARRYAPICARNRDGKMLDVTTAAARGKNQQQDCVERDARWHARHAVLMSPFDAAFRAAALTLSIVRRTPPPAALIARVTSDARQTAALIAQRCRRDRAL